MTLAALSMVAAANNSAAQFPSGKQSLWFFTQEKLDAKTYAGFAKDLFTDVRAGLSDIGYDVRNFSASDSLMRISGSQDNLCMYIHATDAFNGREPGAALLVVDLCKMSELTAAKYGLAAFRPLLSLAYAPDDPASFRSIFTKKIVENLRTQYICNVSIASEPSGAIVKTSRGLTDITPLEWIVPVGSLKIRCSMNKYNSLDKELALFKPGSYSYLFQMRKKQFFNSKFFYPAMAFFVSSAVCYYFDSYYYSRYGRLQKVDYYNSPSSFSQQFQNAKNFENASIATLTSGCCLLGLSFWF
jgi:hypothetical protein